MLLLLAPLSKANSQTAGQVDPSFGASLGLAGTVLGVLPQSDGTVLVIGYFPRGIIRLKADGGLDPSFNAGTIDGPVSCAAVQSDGKIVIGGGFVKIQSNVRHLIARLKTDGSLDASFDPDAGVVGTGNTAIVNTLALQSDGKIVIGGTFSTVGGVKRNNIARLTATGALDTTFNPGSGTDDTVYALTVTSGGKIIVCGVFASVNGIGRARIAALTSSGSVDTTFISPFTATGVTQAVVVQKDGKFVVGGTFEFSAGGSNGVVRLNPDGSRDTGFAADFFAVAGTTSLALQTDGKIVCGGEISPFISRLLPDGEQDKSFGSATAPDGRLTSVAVRKDGKVFIGGYFSSVNGEPRNSVAELGADGLPDNIFQTEMTPGPNQDIQSLALQTDGKMVIGGDFTMINGTSRRRIARLNANGSLDLTFDPGMGMDGPVDCVVIQNGGKILVGGGFSEIDGNSCIGLARLNADGTFDKTFGEGYGLGGSASAIAIQSDGKILVGGLFTYYNTTNRRGILRLDANGKLDPSFDSGAGTTADNSNDGSVYCLSLQPSDGKILIVGFFNKFNGTSANGIARLNTDGSLDTTFNPGTGVSGNSATVYSVAVRKSDGKVVIGGDFTAYAGVKRNGFARLLPSGQLDTSFNPGTGPGGDSAHVNSVAIQGTTSKTIIGGKFTSYNGTVRNYAARVNDDGSLDTSFNAGTGPDRLVYTAVVQADGSIDLGGTFNHVGLTTRNYLARLTKTGAVDSSFLPGEGAPVVNTLDLPTDGSVFVGGDFSSVNGTPLNALARLNSVGETDHDFISGYGQGDVVQDLAVQEDGELIVAATVTTSSPAGIAAFVPHSASAGLSPRTMSIIRNPIHRCSGITGAFDAAFSAYTDGTVLKIAPLSGKLTLICGSFAHVDGTSQANLARLNTDGSLDTSFTAAADGTVRGASVQTDGKIIVAGDFAKVDGTARVRVARLNTNGTLDSTFNPGAGPNGSVNAVRVLASGEVLIGGSFTVVGGVARQGVALLTAKGALDTSFVAGASARVRHSLERLGLTELTTDTTSTVVVNSLDVQSDGKIVIGGAFIEVGGTARQNVARLLADGSLDTSFDSSSGPNSAVHALRLQSDGRTLLGGGFATVGGLERPGAARLFGDASGTAGAVPVITSQLSPPSKAGVSFSYQITASNNPTSFNATGLPGGLFISKATGKITGHPAAAGTYKVVISATNSVGTGSSTLNLVVKDGPPYITGTLDPPSRQGVSFAYQITATSSPTSYTANGLPQGLKIDGTTGKISGKPTVYGTFSVAISATNAFGTGSATLDLVIKQGLPTITSSLTPPARQGVSFRYQITATNDPTSYATVGLPAGLGLSKSIGKVSGTPTKVGTYAVKVSAINGGGTGSATLTLTVKQAVPVITSGLNPPSRVGVRFSYQVTATNSPTKYAISSMPAGLSFNTNTGKLSGIPTKTGTYKPLISATNAGGTGSVNLDLVVKPPT